MTSNQTVPRMIALSTCAAIFAFALTLLIPTGAGAAVRTAATDHSSGERIKTVPIAKSAWSEPRSVLSLGPSKLGDLRQGDRLEAFGEVELTICLKPNPKHPGDGQPCVGNMYSHDPVLKAKVVLGSDEGSSGAGTKTVSKEVGLSCKQSHPVRNHHCVVQIPWSGINIGDLSSLPCPAAGCHLNLVVSAHNSNAGPGELVVVGSSDDNKRIHQGLGKLSMARYRDEARPDKVWKTNKIQTSKLPVGSRGAGIDKRVVHSLRIGKVKAGDQLIVDAKSKSKIGHLPYNVFQRTEVILAKSKNSIKPVGKIVDSTSRVSASNGFNCTLKSSGHDDPCTTRKGGVLSVGKSSKGPWFVNLVAGQHAIGTSTVYNKWRKGDASQTQQGGYVKVERYKGGTATCGTCATGWVNFSPNTPKPADKRHAKLIAQIGSWGINSGRYNCKGRKQPAGYVCKWEAEGTFGSSPQYKCESKGWWKGGRFDLKVCKPALGAQLWDELDRAGLTPTFAGTCKEAGGSDYKCKWFAQGPLPRLADQSKDQKYFCTGYAKYRHSSGKWSIDRCLTLEKELKERGLDSPLDLEALGF